MKIITEYPSWFIVFCFLLGAVYALTMYWNNKRLADFSKSFQWLLGTLRFLVAGFLAFLLLSPLLKTEFREIEKPIIAVVHDNSESLKLTKDSAFYKGEYSEKLSQTLLDLKEKYEVNFFTFGSAVQDTFSLDFLEKETDLSAVFEELKNRYYGRNLGAVVIATDGIYNRGSNPIYQVDQLKVPIYSLALGDTTVKKDALIGEVRHNRLAYLGNKFPVEVLVEAKKLKGKSAVLKVFKDGNAVFSKTITYQSDQEVINVALELEAQKIGVQRYRVSLQPVEGEFTTVNNTKDIYIDVLDGRQKILLLANGPHPDIAALKNAISDNDNYEVKTSLAKNFDGNMKGYSLVIFHQLPSKTNNIPSLLQNVKEKKIPQLFVLGSQTNLNNFNQLKSGVEIKGFNQSANSVGAAFNESFSLFSLGQGTIDTFGKYPPLFAPFGTFEKTASVNVLARQKIGNVTTNYPLIAFNNSVEPKVGFILGEGIWRWRMIDYAEHKSHANFEELIGKTIQFLAARDDKSYFRVYAENKFLENKPLVFQAELYNQAYELVNKSDLRLVITNEEGKNFDFNFGKSGNAYYLNAGKLPAGKYGYVASTNHNGKKLTKTGSFSIQTVNVEARITEANHQLLYQLAEKSGGKLIYPNQLEKLKNTILSRKEIMPVSYTQKKLADMINLKWIFILLLALLSLEWFLRKRNGAY